MTRDTEVSRVWIFVHHFEFSLKTAGLAALLLLSCAHDLPQVGEFGSFFYRKFINCLLKHCAIWKKANFSTKSCFDISELEITREIAQNAKSCSKRKKLLGIREVAKQVADQLVESPIRGWSPIQLLTPPPPHTLTFDIREVLRDTNFYRRAFLKRPSKVQIFSGRLLVLTVIILTTGDLFRKEVQCNTTTFQQKIYCKQFSM